MTNKNNKNAFAGMNTEVLIKNSIGDHSDVINKLKKHFNIKGDFDNAACNGIYSEKSDVRINFTCGHYIDANVKGFKNEKEGFNQLTRTPVHKFCKLFGLNSNEKHELENIIVSKSRNTKNPLFSEEQQKKWDIFFRTNVKEILKWGFSENLNREILVLYDKNTSIVKIYAMKDVLKHLPTDIIFTKGGFNIGNCISFQRKGGNGSISKHPKTTIQHPGNNIQLKLIINKLIPILEPVKLAEYTI